MVFGTIKILCLQSGAFAALSSRIGKTAGPPAFRIDRAIAIMCHFGHVASATIRTRGNGTPHELRSGAQYLLLRAMHPDQQSSMREQAHHEKAAPGRPKSSEHGFAVNRLATCFRTRVVTVPLQKHWDIGRKSFAYAGSTDDDVIITAPYGHRPPPEKLGTVYAPSSLGVPRPEPSGSKWECIGRISSITAPDSQLITRHA